MRCKNEEWECLGISMYYGHDGDASKDDRI